MGAERISLDVDPTSIFGAELLCYYNPLLARNRIKLLYKRSCTYVQYIGELRNITTEYMPFFSLDNLFISLAIDIVLYTNVWFINRLDNLTEGKLATVKRFEC